VVGWLVSLVGQLNLVVGFVGRKVVVGQLVGRLNLVGGRLFGTVELLELFGEIKLDLVGVRLVDWLVG
jgi:hypothetical protein